MALQELGPKNIGEVLGKSKKPEAQQVVLQRLAPEQKSDAFTGEPPEMLHIPGYNPIPEKEFYTSADFADIIGKYVFDVGHIISKIKKKDPRIQGQKVKAEGINARIRIYTKEEFVFLAQDYAERPKRTRISVSPTTQALPEPKKDDVLTFQVNDKEVAVPRKELYSIQDIALTIGSENIPSIMSQVIKARKNDPSIKANYLRDRSTTKVSYPEEDFKKIVLAILAKRASNRSIAARLGHEKHREENFVSLTLPNGTNLNGLTNEERTVLEFFIKKASEGKTVSREEIKDVYIAAGGNHNTANRKIRATIGVLGDKLLETGYTIINTALQMPGTKGAYILRTE